MICAKIMQGLPELKRDGNNILLSIHSELLNAESSTTRANALLLQSEAVPKLISKLDESPDAVRKDFETIRKHSENPCVHLR